MVRAPACPSPERRYRVACQMPAPAALRRPALARVGRSVRAALLRLFGHRCGRWLGAYRLDWRSRRSRRYRRIGLQPCRGIGIGRRRSVTALLRQAGHVPLEHLELMRHPRQLLRLKGNEDPQDNQKNQFHADLGHEFGGRLARITSVHQSASVENGGTIAEVLNDRSTDETWQISHRARIVKRRLRCWLTARMMQKYGRTYHLPISPGATSDDKILATLDGLMVGDLVVTEKMDGENTTIHRGGSHARSPDSRYHPSRDWLKAFAAAISPQLAEEETYRRRKPLCPTRHRL